MREDKPWDHVTGSEQAGQQLAVSLQFMIHGELMNDSKLSGTPAGDSMRRAPDPAK